MAAEPLFLGVRLSVPLEMFCPPEFSLTYFARVQHTESMSCLRRQGKLQDKSADMRTSHESPELRLSEETPSTP